MPFIITGTTPAGAPLTVTRLTPSAALDHVHDLQAQGYGSIIVTDDEGPITLDELGALT
jgi:hypothetical protein